MDFKDAKKLLFSENVKLDFKTADEIIKLMSKPRMLKLLINADNINNRLKVHHSEVIKNAFEL